MAQPAKKPNSFIKGMQSDLDANVMSNDAYKELINGRIFTREDNAFVIKNAQGNTVFTTLQFDALNYLIDNTTLAANSQIQTTVDDDGNTVGFVSSNILGVRLTISGTDFTTEQFTFQEGMTGFNGVTYGYSSLFRDLLWQCTALAMNSPTVSAALTLSVTYATTNQGINLKIIQKSSTTLSVGVEVRYFLAEDNPQYISLTNTNGLTQSTATGVSHEIVGVGKFSDYVAAICKGTQGNDDVVFKLSVNADGTLSTQEALIQCNLDLIADTSLRVEVSEENEHFHRIYWTDGINPLRTVNLKEDPSYYVGLTANDLNVFKSAELEAPIVDSVVPGGIVLCGAHSYCYRLITQDGKTSRTSQITNPVHVAKTTLDTDYHKLTGGPLSQHSANSVTLTINNIDESYTSIQIIDIRFTSSEGAIEANIITEASISGSSFTYTHNGNESVVGISIGDLLRNNVSWDTCKDLAVKNNRLFAANLTNNAQSIDIDFRVKSYRFGTDGSSTAETYSDYINTDLYDDTFYEKGKYAWLNTSHNLKVPGAETPNFDNINDGVRVTFNVKQLDLSEVDYFRNGRCARTGSNGDKAHSALNDVPLFGYLDKTFNGGYDNYKNPIFAKDFVGYQRGEVYRFGILFYDKSGNPTFVSPIGDIRMPDNEMLFESHDSSGARITESSDGARTFKYCGAVPEKSNGWTYSNGDTVLNKTGEGNLHVVGELVTSYDSSVPKGSYITTVTADTITISQATTGGSPGAGMTLYFDKPLLPVSGFAIYPQFEIKLSADTRSKIGGYSIVRVQRGSNDKRILASGVINQNQMHANSESEGSMRHLNGPSSVTNFTPFQSHQSFHVTNFTCDTPEPYFGKFVYDKREGDKIKVVARLDGAYSHYDEDFVEFENIDPSDSHPLNNIKQYAHYNGTTTNQPYFLAGRFDPNAATNNNATFQFSTYPIYSQYYQSAFCVRDVATSDKTFPIYHAETVAEGGTVSDLRNSRRDRSYSGSILKNFKNKIRLAWNGGDDQLRYASDTPSDEKWDVGDGANNHNNLVGAPTMFLSLEGTANESSADLLPEDFECGTGTELQNPFILNYDGNSPNLKLYAQKLYVQFVRNVEGSQYGGNSEAAFENNQYINTGHVNFNPESSNFDSVFGGDTFINMYAKKKVAHTSGTGAGSAAYPAMGIIYPVESSINLDLRDGVFLGSSDDMNYTSYDDNLINETYGCQNTSKTYVQKPANFKDVNTYSNLIAASNLKLAGNLFDAYTTWDASEIHELETGKGPIYNLFNLRGDLFALQQSGVSKLTINPRVVVDNTDAAAVTIATGTGQIIERSDYIDTTYGSQHYNNAIVTNTAAYWYDNNMSAFCKLDYGQGILVQDLGITTQNTNILHSIKDAVINDKPLSYTQGGVCLYHNKILDEVGLCITQGSTSNPVHLVYSELNDIMVTKKSDVVALAFNLPGELLTVGRNSAQAFDTSKVYRENSNGSRTSFYGYTNTNSISMTFVCNENIYTSKKFDKLVLYLSENENSKKFTNFTFTDSVSNMPFETTGTGDKMVYGKHIIPITSTDGTAKATGQHLTIKIESTSVLPLELFGALIHNRITT